jgi:hypothetical protein
MTTIHRPGLAKAIHHHNGTPLIVMGYPVVCRVNPESRLPEYALFCGDGRYSPVSDALVKDHLEAGKHRGGMP